MKKLHDFGPAELLGWTYLISLPPLLAVSLAFEHPTFESLHAVSLQAWGALLFSALVASLIAHTGYYTLVQRYPVTSVAPLTTLSPVFSIVLGVFLLDDRLTSRILIGGACTLLGVLIITLRERRIVDTGT